MYRVTCGVIRNDNYDILVVQRGEKSDHPGKWEFPGGKVESGETDEDCLIREICEEIRIDIIICSQLPEVFHDYGFKRINLVPFVCDTLDETVCLTEHDAYRWVTVREIMAVDLCEADKKVAESYLSVYADTSETNREKIAGKDLTSEYHEDIHNIVDKIKSVKEAEWVASSAAEEPLMVEKLLEYSLSDDRKLAFHASWTLGKAFDADKKIVLPYLDFLVDKLFSLENDSVIRSFLRTIAGNDITDICTDLHGRLADFCFGVLKSGSRPVAIKVYAMEILYKMTILYPELTNELAATISVVMNDGSGALLSRGRMIMKKLKVY